jgi:hypothetical protein
MRLGVLGSSDRAAARAAGLRSVHDGREAARRDGRTSARGSEHVDRVRQVAQPVQAEIAQARACGVPAESGAARVTQIAFTGPW